MVAPLAPIFTNTPPESSSECVPGSGRRFLRGGRVCFLHRRRKTWRALRSEVDARSLSSVHDRGALCYFPRKYLCVRLAVQKAPFYSLCPT